MSKKKEIYQKQQKLSLFNLIAELPNFIVIFISAIFSNSLIVWSDFIDSANNVLHAGFVFTLSKRFKKDLRFEYNYGIGKVEAIASILCDVILVFSMFIMITEALSQWNHPIEPSSFLGYVLIVKIVNIVIDIYILIQQKTIYKKQKTKLFKTEKAIYIKNLCFDSILLISIFISYVFKENSLSWYLAPISTFLIAIYFIVGSFKRMNRSILELSDHTLEEKKQKQILKIIVGFYSEYVSVIDIRSRYSGDIIFIDLCLVFHSDMTYKEIKVLYEKMSEQFKKEIKDSEISFIIK